MESHPHLSPYSSTNGGNRNEFILSTVDTALASVDNRQVNNIYANEPEMSDDVVQFQSLSKQDQLGDMIVKLVELARTVLNE